MKRILVAAVPFIAAVALVAGPQMAMAKSDATCKQVQAELASGKTAATVAKDLKISQKQVNNCSPHVASSAQHMYGAKPSSKPPSGTN